MLDHYQKVAPHLNEPFRMGAGWCERLAPSTQVGVVGYSIGEVLFQCNVQFRFQFSFFQCTAYFLYYCSVFK